MEKKVTNGMTKKTFRELKLVTPISKIVSKHYAPHLKKNKKKKKKTATHSQEKSRPKKKKKKQLKTNETKISVKPV